MTSDLKQLEGPNKSPFPALESCCGLELSCSLPGIPAAPAPVGRAQPGSPELLLLPFFIPTVAPLSSLGARALLPWGPGELWQAGASLSDLGTLLPAPAPANRAKGE